MIRLVKGTAEFDAMKWVISAMDLKDKRDIGRHVFFIAGKAHGTNGHVLHIAPFQEQANGPYSVAVNTAKEIIMMPAPDVQAPDFDRVIPKDKGTAVNVTSSYQSYAAVIRAMPEPWALDYEYFKAAATQTEECTVCSVYNSPVLRFNADNGNVAVVMPLRN